MIVGEQYVRLLSAARFVPACGSFAKDVVRKHFEIPAAGTLLVTESTAAIESAGFRDGVNCVFADVEDVVERLDALLDQPEEYARIVAAGHALVHERHTWQQRDELLQWLRLHRAAEPGQVIVQDGPFTGLRLSTGGRRHNGYPISGGVDRAMLSDAWRALDQRRFSTAERLLLGCMNFQYLPEPIVALSFLELLRGRPEQARHRVGGALLTTLEAHRAADPDPVQWAVWIRIQMCAGNLSAAREAAERYSWLRHGELDRIRQAFARLTGDERVVGTSGRWRVSMNPLPERSAEAWAEELRHMLHSCGRHRLATALAEWCPATLDDGGRDDRTATMEADGYEQAAAVISEVRRTSGLPPLKSAPRKALTLVKRLTGSTLSRTLESILAKEPVSAILVLGSPRRPGVVTALKAAAATNPSRPPVETYRRSGAIEALAGRNEVMVYLGRNRRSTPSPLSAARLLVLETLVVPAMHELFVRISSDDEWALIAHEPSRKGPGFAVFRRVRKAKPMGSGARHPGLPRHQAVTR